MRVEPVAVDQVVDDVPDDLAVHCRVVSAPAPLEVFRGHEQEASGDLEVVPLRKALNRADEVREVAHMVALLAEQEDRVLLGLTQVGPLAHVPAAQKGALLRREALVGDAEPVAELLVDVLQALGEQVKPQPFVENPGLDVDPRKLLLEPLQLPSDLALDLGIGRNRVGRQADAHLEVSGLDEAELHLAQSLLDQGRVVLVAPGEGAEGHIARPSHRLGVVPGIGVDLPRRELLLPPLPLDLAARDQSGEKQQDRPHRPTLLFHFLTSSIASKTERCL
ncbi:MAG: hypothetical protein ACE5F1_03010 [Planctomycetota bacterium]